MDKEQAVNPNKALWEKGNFSIVAESMRESGNTVAKELAVPGLLVLDVGCGDGTTAIPFAQYGCKVLGVDIASNLVEAGRKKAAGLNLQDSCRFEEGDASNLKLESNSFDLVYSQFGAMFAPRPNDVAKELVRVTKPGGRIIMANWIAGDPTFVAQVLRISAKYTPPPPEGFVSPVLWGKEDVVQERFAAAGVAKEDIICERKTYWFVHEMSPQQVLRVFRDYYGPTMNAFEAATKNGLQDQLQAELEELFVACNNATDGTTRIPAVYLRVTVNKK
jgi:ubiquinone/menaquinone biosynthesis C-methylase UbiE